MAKKENQYYNDFSRMVEASRSAAEYLHETLKCYDTATLSVKIKELHIIEHSADEIKHEMIKRLTKEFITPIEREDIACLANEIDNITDKIEDILIRMYMYCIVDVNDYALKFTELIVRCCKSLETAMREFPMFQKSKMLLVNIIEINTMEEEGDRIYIEAVRALYEKGGDELTISSWSKLFDLFEECCDTCEHVANFMENIILKNS